MSYETIIEEIKTVSDVDSPINPTVNKQTSKENFFDAIGEISFDKEACEELRERSII